MYEAASKFQQDVAVRCSQWAAANGLGSDATVPTDVRARIRNKLATEDFVARMGRPPSRLELSSEVARLTRNPTTACAGYDVTFTPVKSVSALWAVAPPSMAAAIEAAHNAAVADALAYLEQRVLFSRRGTNGVRQVEVTGLIGAAFTHRDSRAGDPNLHTHVAIANKVKTLDGAWLAIDGRPLFASMVSISEVYNTQLEAHLASRVGLRFGEIPHRDPAKRAVREIIGVPAQLREAWSSRRAEIEARQAELALDFLRDHNRPPTPVEAIALAQQATLETRQAKHEPRTLAQQRAAWSAQADAVLGPDGVDQMLRAVHAVGATTKTREAPSEWTDRVAAEMVERMAASRASWTVWHLQAEASRRARQRATTPQEATSLTTELLAAATSACVPLGEWVDPISDPLVLRRSDGQSQYSTVGTRRFTSTAVIAAEQQITDAAARVDGRRVGESDVSLAMLSSTANGVSLTAGQIALVREMATSGRRVQLALAPAGSGKTTALSVLADAWRDGGGTVLGLAPSAVATHLLGEQIGTAATLAKVAWDLQHNPRDVEAVIGAETLLIVDEAGMSDTPTLAAVIAFAIDRGASVRLIGDDQQLAAVGAGGVLRDIAHTHGAVRLTEVMRFLDPAEAAASLALRDGRPEALGFYLDNDRIHPGTDESILHDALAAWAADQAAGLEAIMLAGTRDQVATLNRWAREHRLSTTPATADERTVGLSDGNQASIGDLIVTRLNDRRLTTGATDWVKNGDRWTITSIDPGGRIQATHQTSRQRVALPAEYVVDNVELGYAVTVHGAQGITVDTTHTVLAGAETRQQLYVALSRGRQANHTYVEIVDGGNENAPIHPTTLHPATAVDVLESVLARDGSSRSATTEARETNTPTVRLGQAVARYTDALGVAAETTNPAAAQELDREADRVVDDLTSYPAWPTLRAHLILAADHTNTPLQILRAAVDARELHTAADSAAVLTWRLPHPSSRGPLPWLPPIPPRLTEDPQWGPYLAARADQVREFADQVITSSAAVRSPEWALPGQTLTRATIANIEVWRAACNVDPADRRPTGPIQLGAAAHKWQQHLTDQLRPASPVTAWADLLSDIRADIPKDPYTPVLFHRLAALHNTGIPITEHLASAVADGPLPGEHPAAALWWRLARHLAAGQHDTAIPTWEPDLIQHLGIETVANLEASPWWPHFTAAIANGIDHGLPLTGIVAASVDISGFDDHCQALLWQANILTTTHLAADDDWDYEPPPEPDQLPPDGIHDIDWTNRARDLLGAARLREITEPDWTDLRLAQAFAAADRWAETPHTPDRLAQVTAAATAFFEQHLPGSWSQTHFRERFGTDLTADPRFRLGHAPAGWTTLTSHLRRDGFITDELLAAGVSATTRTGNIIDRFRNRAIMPIIHNGIVVGFVGRRHPDDTDTHGPKYLNSPTGPLFAKRDILYGHHLLTDTTTPVIVEGPADAIAVTLAGDGHYIGVAPLGTALTAEQALLLSDGPAPLIATDADDAGHLAAEHSFWLLAQHRHDPHRVHLPTGTDPAQLLHDDGADALRNALASATPQALQMARERSAFLDPVQAARQVAEITAARPASAWAETLGHLPDDLTSRVHAWTTTPAQAAEAAREQSRAMRQRLEQPVEVRWRRWAEAIGLNTASLANWADVAGKLDQLHHSGLDTQNLANRLRHVPAEAVAATVDAHAADDPNTVDWLPRAGTVTSSRSASWHQMQDQGLRGGRRQERTSPGR